MSEAGGRAPARGGFPAGVRVAERRVQVRWSDGDPLGHVNNALFFTYLEIARSGLIQDALGAAAWGDCVLARIELDFVAEIPIAERELLVRSCVLRLGNSSVRTRDEIVLADATVAARAEAVVVLRDMAIQRPRPLSDAERAALSGYLLAEEPEV